MQPQLSFMHQFLHKVSHEQHPGHHQHEWEDKRDGLQVPEGYRCVNCQSDFKKTSNHCQLQQMKRPATQPLS